MLSQNATGTASPAKLPHAWVCTSQTSAFSSADSVEGPPYRSAEPLQPAQLASGGRDSSHSKGCGTDSMGSSSNSDGDGQHAASSHKTEGGSSSSSSIAGTASVPAPPTLRAASPEQAASPTEHHDAATSTLAFGSSPAGQAATVAPRSGSAAAQPVPGRQRSPPPTASAGSVQGLSMGNASGASSDAPSDGLVGRVLHELWDDRIW